MDETSEYKKLYFFWFIINRRDWEDAELALWGQDILSRYFNLFPLGILLVNVNFINVLNESLIVQHIATIGEATNCVNISILEFDWSWCNNVLRQLCKWLPNILYDVIAFASSEVLTESSWASHDVYVLVNIDNTEGRPSFLHFCDFKHLPILNIESEASVNRSLSIKIQAGD